MKKNIIAIYIVMMWCAGISASLPEKPLTNGEKIKKRFFQEKPYHVWNLDLSDKELAILSGIKIKKTKSEGYCNFCSKSGPRNFQSILQDIENADEIGDEVIQILCKVKDEILGLIGPELNMNGSNWVSIENELSPPLNFGWHLDSLNRCDGTGESSSFRASVCIAGEGTMYTTEEPSSELLAYLCKGYYNFNNSDIETINRMIPQRGRRHLQVGQAVVFDQDRFIHTSPPRFTSRIIMLMQLGEK